jgi:hypothetical protein
MVGHSLFSEFKSTVFTSRKKAKTFKVLFDFSRAFEAVGVAVEKAFGWAPNFGGKGNAFDVEQFTKSYQREGYHMPHFADGGIVSILWMLQG